MLSKYCPLAVQQDRRFSASLTPAINWLSPSNLFKTKLGLTYISFLLLLRVHTVARYFKTMSRTIICLSVGL